MHAIQQAFGLLSWGRVLQDNLLGQKWLHSVSTSCRWDHACLVSFLGNINTIWDAFKSIWMIIKYSIKKKKKGKIDFHLEEISIRSAGGRWLVNQLLFTVYKISITIIWIYKSGFPLGRSGSQDLVGEAVGSAASVNEHWLTTKTSADLHLPAIWLGKLLWDTSICNLVCFLPLRPLGSGCANWYPSCPTQLAKTLWHLF